MRPTVEKLEIALAVLAVFWVLFLFASVMTNFWAVQNGAPGFGPDSAQSSALAPGFFGASGGKPVFVTHALKTAWDVSQAGLCVLSALLVLGTIVAAGYRWHWDRKGLNSV